MAELQAPKGGTIESKKTAYVHLTTDIISNRRKQKSEFHISPRLLAHLGSEWENQNGELLANSFSLVWNVCDGDAWRFKLSQINHVILIVPYW